MELSKVRLKQIDVSEFEEKNRTFKGWLSVEVIDKQNEIIPISELEKVMNILMKRGAPIIDTHTNRVVGKILNWERKMKGENEGIYITGLIFSDYPTDDMVWEDIKSGRKTGLSFGGKTYKRKSVRYDEKTGKELVELRDLEAYETSVVEQPANPEARIEEVNLLAKGGENILKPFLGWETFQECVNDQKRKGKSEESAKRICVIPTTKIIMGDRTEKEIKDIKEGEYVISHDGQPHKILKVFKRKYKGILYKLSTGYRNILYITPEHPVMLENGEFKKVEDLIKNKDKIRTGYLRWNTNNMTEEKLKRMKEKNPMKNMQDFFNEWKEKYSSKKIERAYRYLNACKIAERRVEEVRNIFENQGFRFIPIGHNKVIPDAIAIKEGKIFAVEVHSGAHRPEFGKYFNDKRFDDIVWVINDKSGWGIGTIKNKSAVVRYLKEIKNGKLVYPYYEGDVYNLEVEGTQTYIANHIIVHNCGFLQAREEKGDLEKVIDMVEKQEEVEQEKNVVERVRIPDDVMIVLSEKLNKLSDEVGKIVKEYSANKDERPPKEWFDRCVRSVSKVPEVDNPEALCLHPETKILMGDFTLKEIKNIVEGDYVLGGETLTPQRVLKVHKRKYTGKIARLGRKDANQQLFITPEHPVLTEKGWKPVWGLKRGVDSVCKIRYMGLLGAKASIEKREKHNLVVKKLGEVLKMKGFRYIPISGTGVIPDAIAIKDNKVIAIEVEQNAPEISKYMSSHSYDDVFWVINQEAFGKVARRSELNNLSGVRVLSDVSGRRFFCKLKTNYLNKSNVYDGDVYNLTIDNDPTYIAEGFVVHNCAWNYYYHMKRGKGEPKLSAKNIKKMLKKYKIFKILEETERFIKESVVKMVRKRY